MKIENICTRRVATVAPDDSVLHAARVMRDQHAGDVVVVAKSDQGPRPIGILTDRDIVVGIVAQGISNLEVLSARDAMGRELETVGIDDDIFRAIHRMMRHGIRRLPVVNDLGVLVGIVTYDDLVRGVAEQLADFTRDVTQQECVERARRAAS